MSWRMLATDTNKQILIVDQDVASIEPLRQKLGEAGFVVRAITDGSAAITAVATGQEDAARLRNWKASSPRRQAPRDTSDRAIDQQNASAVTCAVTKSPSRDQSNRCRSRIVVAPSR